MKDYIENNIEIVKELIKIDSMIMKETINISTLLNNASNKTNLILNNSLIFYDGNPYITIKLINSDIENCVLYPNDQFIAINKFIVSYKDSNHLSIENNDFKYDKAKDIFDLIIVLNDFILYEQLKEIYPNIKYIEI